MKQRLVFLSVAILFILSCNLIAPIGTLPAATQPGVVEQTEVPTKAAVVTAPPTVETVPPTEAPAAEDTSGQIARGYLEALTANGPRPSGGENERQVAKYIRETFTKLGYTPETTAFSAWDENDNVLSSQNIFAVKKGDSPLEIIVGAHYDSGKEGDGVDDNASGVAVMLEVAERVANLQTPYTIRFIAFGSEENDLDGSYYYTAHGRQGCGEYACRWSISTPSRQATSPMFTATRARMPSCAIGCSIGQAKMMCRSRPSRM